MKNNNIRSIKIALMLSFVTLLINLIILRIPYSYAQSNGETVTGGVSEVSTIPTLSEIKSQSITITGAVISVSCDKSASIYYIVTSGNGNNPTKEQILQGVNSEGLVVIEKGYVDSNGMNDSVIVLTGLEQENSYTIYLYANDIKTEGSSIVSYNFQTKSSYLKVIYESNGSTSGVIPIDENKYSKGDTLVVMDNIGSLNKIGYYFSGWNTKSNGSGINRTPNSLVSINSNDIILYAKWTAEKYYVRYNGNEHNKGYVPSSGLYHKYNDVVTISYPGSMSKQGFTFIEWNTKADGTGKSYTPGEKIRMPNSDIKLFAIWSETTLIVKFDSVGGSSVEKQTVPYGAYINPPKNVHLNGYRFVGWFTSLAYKTEFNIKTKPITTNITLYAKWEKIISNNEVIPVPVEYNSNLEGANLDFKGSFIDNAVIVFNNEIQNVGSIITLTNENISTTSIIVDNLKLQSNLVRMKENSILTMPIKTGSESVICQLNAKTIKDMAQKNITLDIQTEYASYKLPTIEISLDKVLFMEIQDPKNINVQIEISKVKVEKFENIQRMLDESSIQLLVEPIDFKVKYLINGVSYEINKYDTYVERSVILPEDIDYSKISTGVTIERNGAIRHVPYTIISIYGKYYIIYKSMSNSMYSLAWNQVAFNDLDNHWAKDVIEEIGSKLIVTGNEFGDFLPDDYITRAEFNVVLSKAIGLPNLYTNSYFDDIYENDWFAGYINSSYEYHLIDGNGSFKPSEYIEREEAMILLGKALVLMGINDIMSDEEVDDLLSAFSDNNQISVSARKKVALCIKNDIINGKEEHYIAPHDMLTRAEVAVMISKVLKKFD